MTLLSTNADLKAIFQNTNNLIKRFKCNLKQIFINHTVVLPKFTRGF